MSGVVSGIAHGGSATDGQAVRRVVAPPKVGGNTTAIPPIDISAIQNLLSGVVLDHEDATAALNKLVQRALRALPFVKVEHLRDVLDRFELCVQLLEANSNEADIENRLTPGSRVSRLKFDTLKTLAMKDDGINPTQTGVTRVVIPDHRLPNGGMNLAVNNFTVLNAHANGELVGTPPSAGFTPGGVPHSGHNRSVSASAGHINFHGMSGSGSTDFQRRATAAVNSLAAAAMIGSAKPPANTVVPASMPGVNSDGSFVSPREQPLPPFVPTPLPIAPVASGQITKDYDSPSMARRTLSGVKLGGGTGPGGSGTPPSSTVAPGVIAANALAASSRAKGAAQTRKSDSDEDEKGHASTPAEAHAPAPAPAATALGLGLHGAGAGGAKPRNKHLEKSSRASTPTTPLTGLPAAADPKPAASAPPMSLDASPSMAGRRIGKAPAAATSGAATNVPSGHGRTSATQSALISAAVGPATGGHSKSTSNSSNSSNEDEKIPELPALEALPTVGATTAAPRGTAPAPAPASTPAPTPSAGANRSTEPSTESTRAQLQALLNRALRLVPSYRFSPATFRTLHTQFETAVAFMEERCSTAAQ